MNDFEFKEMLAIGVFNVKSNYKGTTMGWKRSRFMGEKADYGKLFSHYEDGSWQQEFSRDLSLEEARQKARQLGAEFVGEI